MILGSCVIAVLTNLKEGYFNLIATNANIIKNISKDKKTISVVKNPIYHKLNIRSDSPHYQYRNQKKKSKNTRVKKTKILKVATLKLLKRKASNSLL